ncbi:glycosyltransferase [Chachezhania sediminis]|uniref:glycosyltransferase n=1 Tax=Chachezhania sediminis TaxID=2599291 RepID=UPI00131D8B26|nr:glycosyltransferase [Chachezhania sediminis]
MPAPEVTPEISPAISVVTINYNDLEGLYATLSSAAAQLWPEGAAAPDWELVVVDGGSSDGSAKVVEDFDPWIARWVSAPDGGIYDAMNRGVSMARGRYVNFMNAGDCFFDGSVLARAAAHIAAREATGTVPGLFAGRAYAQNSGKRYQYNDVLWKGMVCSHQATFSRRDLHQRFPFSTTLKIASDYRFYVQCEDAGFPLEFTDIDVARIDTSGVSFLGLEGRTLERLGICREYYRRPEVWAHFDRIAREGGFALPDWAATEAAFLAAPEPVA